jgi:hypothetical protein
MLQGIFVRSSEHQSSVRAGAEERQVLVGVEVSGSIDIARVEAAGPREEGR